LPEFQFPDLKKIRKNKKSGLFNVYFAKALWYNILRYANTVTRDKEFSTFP